MNFRGKGTAFGNDDVDQFNSHSHATTMSFHRNIEATDGIYKIPWISSGSWKLKVNTWDC